jgi:hypothetical protein
VTPVRIPLLGLRIALPLALFTLHVAFGFTVGAIRCDQQRLTSTLLGVSLAREIVLLGTLVAAVLALWCGASAAVDLVRLRREDPDADPAGLLGFGLLAAIGMASLVAIYLVWATIATGVSEVC